MLHVNFHLSGSIAAFKACEVISALIKQGHEVQTICTPSALKFVGSATLEGLTGKPVLSDLFAAGRNLDHIRLVKWADLSIVCPATANLINKLAAGIADTPTGALFLAHDFSKPWLLAPAMNPAMYGHSITQASLEKLKKLGVQILKPANGRVACGDEGEGRLLEPQEILNEIAKAASSVCLQSPIQPRRIIITAGGTREPIDGVRYISNLSSGATGAVISDELLKCGHQVVYLHGENAKKPTRSCEQYVFGGFTDLDHQLKTLLGTRPFDAIIHLAAVSDFSVEQIEVQGKRYSPEHFGKLSSSAAPTLHLKRNFKIVDRIRGYSKNERAKIIAFKLTHTADPKQQELAIHRLWESSKADLIVHNDVSGIQGDQHQGAIYAGKQVLTQFQTKTQLAQALVHFIEEGEAL
ncbi:bifunctional phosphopantothenoylcysteine decarboxylase/phosphopantothenate--cysteine ligase CoaBC [Bdellovibrionota bacterium FG-2]